VIDINAPVTDPGVKNALDKRGNARESLLPILLEVVKENSFLTDTAMKEIAGALDISSAEVFGVASFYEFLPIGYNGKNTIRVCKNISCYIEGKDEIIKAIEDFLKIKAGETTRDGKFTFKTANCLGWCHKGPAMLINDTPHTDLTPEKAIALISEYT